MSFIFLLLPFMLWFAWVQNVPRAGEFDFSRWEWGGVFLGFYLLLILLMGLWSRLVARRVASNTLGVTVERFHKVMSLARMMIPAWFAFGLFSLGWGEMVLTILKPIGKLHLEAPAALLATLPAMLAWCGLFWSQYPADRALREQSLLIQLDNGLPVHAAPGFVRYFISNLRVQVLLTVIPVVLILIARDLFTIVLGRVMDLRNINPELLDLAFLPAAILILIISPELLRRILHTQPLPQSDLRDRLEEICRRNKLRYRDVLLWQTDNNMGNAAVIGLVPRFRYILLSDLLLETMTDEQIEAVFAHEVGHVVHRHIAWFLAFLGLFMLFSIGPGDWLTRQIPSEWAKSSLSIQLIPVIVTFAGFLAAFGFISRRFERQADVFAARTIEAIGGTDPEASHVGPYGAGVFASALYRVAVVNNIPISARSWRHGSIETRMQYIEQLALDPERTGAFDRFMMRMYFGLLALLAGSGVWVLVVELRG